MKYLCPFCERELIGKGERFLGVCFNCYERDELEQSYEKADAQIDIERNDVGGVE